MSVPAVEPPEPVDHESAVLATALRIKVAFTDRPHPPEAKTMESAEQVWGLIYGQLRGRIPFPVPPDLMTVAASAGVRIHKGFRDVGSGVLSRDGRMNDVIDLRPWSGWMMHERVILNRYRQRTA